MTQNPAEQATPAGPHPATSAEPAETAEHAEHARPALQPAIEARWQEVWERLGVFRARDDGSAERRYLLTMFPYPSGDLHMGHAEVFALEDVVARYWRQRGFDVLNPVGWDSFGLPAENAAIRRDESPEVFTDANIATQARSIRRYGVSFDWSRRLRTSDPEYMRWTQWLFVRLVERGLAYRATAPVSWCPQDATVLANEQVVGGSCERCGTPVVRRDLTQWFVRITDYADRLVDDMDELAGRWPERVLAMQRNWIGRSRGAQVDFQVVGEGAVVGELTGEGADDAPRQDRLRTVSAFTSRPETIFGVTFLAVAPDAEVARDLCSPDRAGALDAYRAASQDLSDIDRQSTSREKTGVFLGTFVSHPVTGERLPVWATDYVLPGYASGVVMGVPAHDERDRAFAERYDLPVRPVLRHPTDGDARVVDVVVRSTGGGLALDGLGATEAGERAVAWLSAQGRGGPHVAYRLRDWLVSRQRYWGAPVPIVHCAVCGEVPVPDEELPVRLPDLRGKDLVPHGVSPLAGADEWVRTPCPRCGREARRDTDTLDTFVDSSWYFLRYCSPGYTDGPFDPDAVRRWLPVAQYVGGVEHAILHLLYSRFVTKVLHDMGLVDVVEPFGTLLNQGQVINQGKAMSKSLGNGVDLGAQLDAYGVDAVRLTMVFAGPPEDDVDWADLSPGSMKRFLGRVLRLARDVASPAVAEAWSTSCPAARAGDEGLRRVTHRAVRDVTDLLEASRFNVAVARVMELTRATRKAVDTGPGPGDPAVREAAETLAILLSLFAPYTAEEMWAALGHAPSVATAGWPVVDAGLLTEATVEAVVQVDGRVRDRLNVSTTIGEDALRAAALGRDAVRRAVGDRTVARVVVRAPRLVNVVTA
jgi:leucyl-tRNA synthetase